MKLQVFGKLVLVIQLVWVIKVSSSQDELNCLKSNSRTLQGSFNWYNRVIDPWAELPMEELLSMIKLFSNRFDKAFVLNGIPVGDLLPVALSVANLRAKSNSTVQLYLKNHLPDVNSKNETIRLLKGITNMIRTVHKVSSGTVGGLILQSNLETYTMQLEAFEEVFGPLEKFVEFKLGMRIDKSKLYKSAKPSELIKKLQFLVVIVDVKISRNPELSADAIISSCDYLQANARLKGITAEIFCWTGYPSKGTTASGVEGSLGGFQRFWCRIVERLKSEEGHAKIIMRSAFDESSTAIPVTSKNENIDEVLFGWWSRISAVSSYASDFEEKVELLKNISRSEAKDGCKCCSLDLTYVFGFLVILIVQSSLIACVLMMTIKNKDPRKKKPPTSEDNPTFEMSSSESNEQNLEDLLGLATK